MWVKWSFNTRESPRECVGPYWVVNKDVLDYSGHHKRLEGIHAWFPKAVKPEWVWSGLEQLQMLEEAEAPIPPPGQAWPLWWDQKYQRVTEIPPGIHLSNSDVEKLLLQQGPFFDRVKRALAEVDVRFRKSV